MMDKIGDINSTGFFLNICNDTVVTCGDENNPELYFDSSFIYRNGVGQCIRISGTFYKYEYNKSEKNFLIYDSKNKIFEYVSDGGDLCWENTTFKTKFVFHNDKNLDYPNLEYEYKKNAPNIMNEGARDNCLRIIDITVNFEQSIDHLHIQKFFNNYWIFTGIVLFIIGIYLMILAQNKKATKFVIGVIFGEIFTFTISCGIIGFKVQSLEWFLFIAGIIIGGFIGYFSLEKNKLYRKFLSLTAGYILGIFLFDIIFLHQNYQSLAVFLTDSILIFMVLIFTFIYLLPEYHYFCDSIIGAYLFIRGISVLMQKLGKYGRYRELQLILYLINNFEFEYAKYFYKKQWPLYFIYDIFIFLFMVVSMLYYYFKAVGKDEDEEEEKEDKIPEMKLLSNKKTTETGEDMLLE